MIRPECCYTWFSLHFPLPSQHEDTSDKGWARLLQEWRANGKLKQMQHYRRIPHNGSNIRCVYDPKAVIRLIVMEGRSNKTRRRVAFLLETYMEAFCKVMEAPDTGAVGIGTPETIDTQV